VDFVHNVRLCKKSIKEYSELKGISPQAVYKKIESGKLTKVKKNGLTYIEVFEDDSLSSQQIQPNVDNGFINYLTTEVKRQNHLIQLLQEQLIQCKNDGINRVIEINQQKDNQLQKYIEFLNNSTQQLITQAIQNKETYSVPEAEIVEDEKIEVELMRYLKNLGKDKEQRKNILKKAHKAIIKDSLRFRIKDESVYIFPNTFNYSDLF
jgi:hypothetical protein